MAREMADESAMSEPATIQLSPLNDAHLKLGGKLIPFAGFSMPVQYTGIADEHLTVRSHVGVFDISHMGQFFVNGTGAGEWLNAMLTNNVAKLSPGHGQYSMLLNENGGVIDDLIIYQVAADDYFLVVNASMIAEDYAALSSKLASGVTLVNDSNSWAGLAIQGPESAALYDKLCGADAPLPPRNGIVKFPSGTGEVIVCRTGYTGEDGFEFFCPVDQSEAWLQKIIDLGAKPCGLGARDTLRLEMGYPLNGNDLSPAKTPLEAGLGFFVDLTKPFVGSTILEQQKAGGIPTKLAGIKLIDKGPPLRSHYSLWHEGAQVGEINSGGVSPSLNASIGMAYLPTPLAQIGTRLEADIRGKRYAVEVVKKPFYKKA